MLPVNTVNHKQQGIIVHSTLELRLHPKAMHNTNSTIFWSYVNTVNTCQHSVNTCQHSVNTGQHPVNTVIWSRLATPDKESSFGHVNTVNTHQHCHHMSTHQLDADSKKHLPFSGVTSTLTTHVNTLSTQVNILSTPSSGAV